MKAVVYCGPTDQVVPEMAAQDDHGGTLVLRPGQQYSFGGEPPGDPAWWIPVSKTSTRPADSVSTPPPAPAAPAQEG